MELPCLIISGFLGSGKTTYLNSLLREANGLRLGVLVNDFGDVPIDYDLIESADDNVLELSGGCVCCTYGGDLLSALTQMIARPNRFDALIIETSGLSLPGIVAASVKLVPGIKRVCVLGLVDGLCLASLVADKFLSDTIVRQIQESDLILLTKVDPHDYAKQTSVREILAGHSRHTDVVVSLLPRDVFERIFSGVEFAENARVPSRDSLFSGSMSYPNAKAPPVSSITLTLPGVYNLEIILNRLKVLDLPMIRAKGIFGVTTGGFSILNFTASEWDIKYRAEPPTKPGMTFFFVGDAVQKDEVTRQILTVFDASESN